MAAHVSMVPEHHWFSRRDKASLCSARPACEGAACTAGAEALLPQVTVLNAVATKLPFLPADEDAVISEEVRLRTRVLDLR